MNQPARILVIDNLAVESLRREVYRALARMFGWEVHLLVPTAWRETREAVACENEAGNLLRIHPSRIAFGFRHQRVLYLDLPGIVKKVKPHFILAVAQPESYAAAEVCIVRRLLAPHSGLAFFSSRNIDYPTEGFPYKFKVTHRLCDTISRKSRPDICFYRPEAAGKLLAPYARHLVHTPHVVDCRIFQKWENASAAGQKRRIVVGYVGRLVQEKGVFTLLEAIRHLPDHVTLKMVGMGPEERSLRQKAEESGVAGRVEFQPPAPYQEIPAILNGLDVLALPSHEVPHWTELFGRILIEAMACEVPIVASRSGGIPEVIGDAGLLVEPGDSRALAVALDRLCLDESERCRLGQKGRERARRCFDVPVVAGILGREMKVTMASNQRGGLPA